MKRSFGGFGALAQLSAVIRPGDEISRTDYVGPCVYREGKMSMVLIAGGYIEVTDSGYAYRYYLSDHQGNVRAVIDQDGALVEANDYYPYGQPMPVAGAASAANAQPYKYGGKELLGAGSDATVSTALAGVYDFGARWHSSLSAAFTQPDPKSETYPAISPYAYCAANPIRYTDPTGCIVQADTQSIKNIYNTLFEDERKYIVFNEDGIACANSTEKVDNPSNNLSALLSLIKSELKYEFSTAEINPSTNKPFRDNSDDDYYRGITMMPNSPDSPSKDNNVHVVVGSVLSEEQQALTTAHEAYGHALMFENTRNAAVSLHDFHYEFVGETWDEEYQTNGPVYVKEERNKPLEKLIKAAVNQVNGIFQHH